MTTQIQANESQIKEPPRKGATSGTSVFLLIWFGQVIALIGSGLTGFALGVWVYQQTGSAIQLSIIVIFTRLPGIVVSPLAGALVDRLDRRLVLILCDLGAGLSVLSMDDGHDSHKIRQNSNNRETAIKRSVSWRQSPPHLITIQYVRIGN